MDIAKIRKKARDSGGLKDAPGPRPEAEALGSGASEEAIQTGLPSAETVREKGGGNTPQEMQGIGGPGATVELLTFKLAEEEYAFRIDEIQEIIRPQGITRIPRSRPHLIGITSLRGKIIPVVDLKMMLSLRGEGGGHRQKILVLRGSKGPFGALVDRVMGVIRPSVSSIVETPAHLPEAEMRFIDGVTAVNGRFVSIIKTEEIVEAL